MTSSDWVALAVRCDWCGLLIYEMTSWRGLLHWCDVAFSQALADAKGHQSGEDFE
jgi:hypothetical protein